MRLLARSGRSMPALLAVACALLGFAATARAAPAHLDRGFGTNGIRFLSSSLRETIGTALLGDGRVLVGGEHGLVALLPSGRLDPGFGKGGYVRIVQPPVGVAEASTVAVDRRGRPVVVGSLSVEPKGPGLLTEPGVRPFIERFTARGKIDLGFGGGDGYVVSDLGLPFAADGEPPESFLNWVAFDAAGRLVIGGRSYLDVSAEGGGVIQASKPFLARFDDAGGLDRPFAAGGVYSPEGGERIENWEAGPGNRLTVSTGSDREHSILRLGADGVPERRFGTDGRVANPFGAEYSSLLVDPKGRTLLYHYVEGVAHRLPNGIVLKRLRSDGSPDRGFGDAGTATVRIPRFYTTDLAIDPHGGILLAVSLKAWGPIGESVEFALVRLREDGGLDGSFAGDGMIRIPFPGRPSTRVNLEGMDVRGGRAIIAASYCGHEDCRPAVAMVDLGG